MHMKPRGAASMQITLQRASASKLNNIKLRRFIRFERVVRVGSIKICCDIMACVHGGVWTPAAAAHFEMLTMCHLFEPNLINLCIFS